MNVQNNQSQIKMLGSPLPQASRESLRLNKPRVDARPRLTDYLKINSDRKNLEATCERLRETSLKLEFEGSKFRIKEQHEDEENKTHPISHTHTPVVVSQEKKRLATLSLLDLLNEHPDQLPIENFESSPFKA